MTMTFEPIPVPLAVDADGAIRVGGTRLLFGLVVDEFRKGASPDEIVQSYDILSLADAYTVIAYYLTYQSEIDAYLAQQEQEVREWLAQYKPRFTREELQRRLEEQRARTRV